jgi:hypothetical protein
VRGEVPCSSGQAVTRGREIEASGFAGKRAESSGAHVARSTTPKAAGFDWPLALTIGGVTLVLYGVLGFVVFTLITLLS